MVSDDVQERSKALGKFTLETLLKQPAAAVPPVAKGEETETGGDQQELAKKSDPRPKPGDPYRPHAQFINRLMASQPVIHFVANDCKPKGMAYSHFEWIEQVEGRKSGIDLVVRFSGSVVTDVRIEGRNLDFIYDCIAMHLMPWIWERPEGIYQDADDAVVITKITFTETER